MGPSQAKYTDVARNTGKIKKIVACCYILNALSVVIFPQNPAIKFWTLTDFLYVVWNRKKKKKKRTREASASPSINVYLSRLETNRSSLIGLVYVTSGGGVPDVFDSRSHQPSGRVVRLQKYSGDLLNRRTLACIRVAWKRS